MAISNYSLHAWGRMQYHMASEIVGARRGCRRFLELTARWTIGRAAGSSCDVCCCFSCEGSRGGDWVERFVGLRGLRVCPMGWEEKEEEEMMVMIMYLECAGYRLLPTTTTTRCTSYSISNTLHNPAASLLFPFHLHRYPNVRSCTS